MAYSEIVPYTCLFMDCSVRHFLKAALRCSKTTEKRDHIEAQLSQLWMPDHDRRPVLPCLSVRTGLDMYLQLRNFPPGSEIIMSAINIPDMVRVVHHHNLKVVSLDVAIETMAPKDEWLEKLITSKTVAVILAHVYGKWFHMEPFIKIAKKYNLAVIEDCAEVFCGFKRLGHLEADLSLFSFGVIKYSTAFGGAIAKIRDVNIYTSMSLLQNTYPVQSPLQYLYKVLKYFYVYFIVNCPRIIRPGIYLSRVLGIDLKQYFVTMLRGFPGELVPKLRYQPSTALLSCLLGRFQEFSVGEFELSRVKAEYVLERVSEDVLEVGSQAAVRNHWLFPIVVEYPQEIMKMLNILGVDAYRGATQLSLVEPDAPRCDPADLKDFVHQWPHEAQFFMDHVIYLPVNKIVPFQELDKVCVALDTAIRTCNSRYFSLQANSSKWPLRPTSKL